MPSLALSRRAFLGRSPQAAGALALHTMIPVMTLADRAAHAMLDRHS